MATWPQLMLVTVAALGVAAGACSGLSIFTCATDEECADGGVHGFCEDAGYCSFPDGDCDSGKRYSKYAGSELAGQCVVEGQADTGTSTSTSTTSTSTFSTTSPLTETSDTLTTSSSSSSGSGSSETTESGPVRVEEGLLVLYLFDEGAGGTVNDQAPGTPLDLEIVDEDAVTWMADGLSIDSETRVVANDPATKIFDACTATDEVSFEAWVTPAAAVQGGPGRIVTYSLDAAERNFTLGHGTSARPLPDFVARLRTSMTNINGLPDFQAPDTVTTMTTHVVYTRAAAAEQTLFVDGVEVAMGNRPGDFSTWDPTFTFLLANEVIDSRPWFGVYHLVAVYEQALTPAEVQQNFDAGF